MANVPTPHIKAKMGEIAEKILMPGDPLRAKFIAENYLSDAVCVNDTRNMLGFTGNYKGSKVTVMGSGMGVSSIGIYSYELFNFYEAETIIRIGTAGAYEFQGKKTNYKQFLNKIETLGKAYKSIGINEGDMVTVCMPTSART